jgi:hypothetical protein
MSRLRRDVERSELMGMANTACVHCWGTGLLLETYQVCACVDRNVFRACLARFRACAEGAGFIAPVSLDARGLTYSRTGEEYMADFHLVAKRALRAGIEWDVFRYHFLLGADWKLCCRRLGINRGNFFHAVYAIEAKLGRVLRTLEPYALWPLDEYFMGAGRGARTTAILAQMEPRRVPLVPPLAKAA